MSQRLTAILLAAQLIYFFLLASFAGKVISTIGCLVALLLLVGPSVSARFSARARKELAPDSHTGVVVPMVLFGAPLLSLVGEPRIAFWRVTGSTLLILSWLAIVLWLMARQRGMASGDNHAEPSGRLSLLTHLFILWTALFWLSVIWDIGIRDAVLLVAREDRLTTSFELWETRPASEHLYLVWLNRDMFEQGVAYTNHLHPILFFFYGCAKLVQLSTGFPLYIGRNMTPFVMAGLAVTAFAALLPRPTRRSPHGAKFHATLFFALGFFLSDWHFWIYPYRWGFDTMYPILASLAALVFASARPVISQRNGALVTLSLVLFAMFGWLYTPIMIFALWCEFARMRQGVAATLAANRPLARASMIALAVGTVTYVVPLLLVWIRGYENTSSSFVYRSGLDGDTQHFQNVVQAIYQPFRPARSWWALLLPAFVPLIISAAANWKPSGIGRHRMGRQAIFLLAPYLFSLAVFPQSVSIHPNLYDMLLLLPVLLMGCTWMLTRSVQSRLRGASVLAAVLLGAILIMANFISIAQGVRQLVGR